MSTTITRRTFLSASLLALCIPSKLFAQGDKPELVLRFAALSDVHYDRSHNEHSAERVRFAKALRFMNEYSAKQTYDRFDALLVAGDFSNHGVIEEIGPFKKTMDENLNSSTRRILCMGNHEYYGGNRELWENTFETEANRRQEVNGYQFITISPDKGSCNENDYVYLRDWLEQNLKEAVEADPTKPIFVLQHYHVYDTVYGSADHPGDFHAGVKDIADILSKYPQAIHISGHSHIPSVDPRAIWQGDFTAIGTGSMSYFAFSLYERQRNFKLGSNVPYQQAGTFLIFEVYKDSTIRIRLYDTISDSFLDREYLLVDPLNVDKYVYTNKRFDNATPPRWSSNAAAEIVDLASTAASIRFSQGQDDFCVVSYRIAAEIEKDGQWESFKTYNVWSDYFMKTRLEKIEYAVFDLLPESKYRFKIYATGAFQKETLEPLTLEFQTPAENANKNNAELAPRGDFIDVVFDKSQGPTNAIDGPNHALNIQTLGTPSIVEDASLGTCASFNGVDQCYLLPYNNIADAIIGTSGVTLYAKFRLDLSKHTPKEPVSIFGSTENGGLGFEYYAEKQQLLTRCWIGNKYEDLLAEFDGQGETTAVFVYDGKETRLYLNGVLASSAAHEGAFRLTENATSRAFCIGGDVCPDMKARWFFPGEIANVRVYTYPLTQQQIEAISK